MHGEGLAKMHRESALSTSDKGIYDLVDLFTFLKARLQK